MQIKKQRKPISDKSHSCSVKASDHWAYWYSLMLVGLIALILYLNTLPNGFVYDDIWNILNNPIVYAPKTFPETFQALKEPWRPLVVFSYAVTHLGFGFNASAYHAGNIIIHAINSILVCAIAWQLAAIWLPKNRTAIFAVMTGMIFAVHPLNSEAVSYIWGRTSSLCGTFYFGSILLVIHGYRHSSNKKQFLYFGCALVAGLLAWKAKVEAITLPLLISGFFWLVGWRLAASSTILVPFAILVSRLSDLSALYNYVGSQNRELILAGAVHPLTPGIYVMTSVKSSVFYYLSKFIIPVNLSVDPFIKPANSTYDPFFLSAFLVLVGLVILGFLARHRYKLLAFGIMALIVSPLTSYGVIAVADVVAEHRVYIAGLGFAIIVAWVGSLRPKIMVPTLIAFTAVLFWITFERNTIWANSISLWQDAAIKSPELARPHLNLGAAYQERGLYEKAMKEYKRSIALNPNLSVGYSNLGVIYLLKDDLYNAEASFKKAIQVSPERIKPYLDLATVALRQHAPEKALQALDKAEKLGNLPLIHFGKGEALYALDRYDEAMHQYDLALSHQDISEDLAQQINMRLQQIRNSRAEKSRQ